MRRADSAGAGERGEGFRVCGAIHVGWVTPESCCRGLPQHASLALNLSPMGCCVLLISSSHPPTDCVTCTICQKHTECVGAAWLQTDQSVAIWLTDWLGTSPPTVNWMNTEAHWLILWFCGAGRSLISWCGSHKACHKPLQSTCYIQNHFGSDLFRTNLLPTASRFWDNVLRTVSLITH
jgi:hypothetical protein